MTYFYEHVNGAIIEKPDIVVETNTTPEEYFAGPFVVRWWKPRSEKAGEE